MIKITPNVISADEALDLIAGSECAGPMNYYDGSKPASPVLVKPVTEHPVVKRLTEQLGMDLVKAEVLHYPIGAYLNVHCDQGAIVNGQLIQKAFYERTAIIYLDECGGGETFFPYLGVVVRPTPFLMVDHPAGPDYLHGVSQVFGKSRHTLILRLS